MQKNAGKFGISDKRGRLASSLDPYRTTMGSSEPARCSACRSVYRNKRWQQESPSSAENKASGESELRATVCPAPQDRRWLHTRGYDVARELSVDACCGNLQPDAACRETERILRMEQEGDTLVIETTAEKLVEHLGRALHKAHQGELHVTWNDGHEVCRVEWARQ